MKKFVSVLIVAGVILSGCSNPVVNSLESRVASEIAEAEDLGQMLPIEAQMIVGDETIDLEVARTAEEQSIGLMYREYLPGDRGMLFPFETERQAKFWMKNTKIPLDMIFVREGEIRAIAENVPPCTTNPCPSYGPSDLVDQVIELSGGRAEELGLEVGDLVVINYPDREVSAD